MIYGIVFDLDGTLLNTLEDLTDSVNFALNKFGYRTRTIEEVRTFVGDGVRVMMTRAIPNGLANPDFEDCLTCFKEHYKDNMFNKTAPYVGISEMLKTLKLNGIQVAVVSNKFDFAVKGLCKKYFGDLITVAIGENEAEGIRKKPAPDSVFKAIHDMKVRIENVIFVGDSDTDVLTAKNAEVDCIGCTWGFRDRETLEKAGATYIVQEPCEILKIAGVKL